MQRLSVVSSLLVRDVILQDLIQNIFPDSLTDKIAWTITSTWMSLQKYCYVKKVSHAKDYILYDSIYIKFSNRPSQFTVVDVVSNIWIMGRRLDLKGQWKYPLSYLGW